MTKIELRQEYLSKRKALTPLETAGKSRRIALNFFDGIDLSRVKVIHCFIPMKKFNEVDTSLIIRALWTTAPEIRTLAPRLNDEAGEMESFDYSAGSELIENGFGILEPAGPEVIDPELIDLVIVPGLAFDRTGHRVGYGKGYYDRFLKRCRPDCKKIGVSYFEAVDDILDIHEGDEALDACVTPAGICCVNKRRAEDR